VGAPIGLNQLEEDFLKNVFHVAVVADAPPDEIPQAWSFSLHGFRDPPVLLALCSFGDWRPLHLQL
jgi:hypothetical protein